MKILTVCMLLLLSSFGHIEACGPYYPDKEDYRVQFIQPPYFLGSGYSGFLYSSASFHEGDATEVGADENVALWWKYCKSIPKKEDIKAVVYADYFDFEQKPSTNSFVQYLQAQQDNAAIEYLRFAYKCSVYNSFGDPWEEDEAASTQTRKKYLELAAAQAANIQNEALKQRYAFLAIRLAYYESDVNKLQTLYSNYFENKKERNLIDYWALSFMAQTLNVRNAETNYYAAQIFVHAPDKRRLAFYELYNRKVDVEETLALATTAEERAAVWLMYGLVNPAKNLEIIKQIYQLTPNSELLDFMLLREVNKLEDWVYTPHYKAFEPTSSSIRNVNMAARLARDRAYAQELLSFVQSVIKKDVSNPLIWQMAKASLFMIGQDYINASNELKMAAKMAAKNPDVLAQIEGLGLLCELENSPIKGVEVPNKMKTFLLQADDRFEREILFAMARTLEYQGNTTLAALLFSKVNSTQNYSDIIYWRTTKGSFNGLEMDYYGHYLNYLEMQYSAEALQALIDNLKETPKNNPFSQWLYAGKEQHIPHLYDILGTRYIQQNKLEWALQSFEQVPDSIWNSYPYNIYLRANAFYTNLYSEHQPTEADSVVYTKTSLTRTLIEYLRKAENPLEKDRDYYYFLVATAYFNMTQYGNSWMMRRSYWSIDGVRYALEDDDEFFKCLLAKTYFAKAASMATHPKFKILCQAMVGRCEQYRLRQELLKEAGVYYWEREAYATVLKKINEQNVFYRNLEVEHPTEYEELTSNCYTFDTYMEARLN